MSPVQQQALRHYAERQRAKQELERRASRTDSSLWQPLPGPQTQAFTSLADVVGYGGAAGGGKSDLAIGLALTQHSRSVIFRREALQARDLFDRTKAITGGAGRFNETMMLCRELPGERILEFAGVKDAGDVQKWRGRPHDYIAFDEATEFLEAQVRFLAGWVRTTIPGQRCQIVLAFNPPSTSEGRWVIRYFAPWLDPSHPHRAAPGELRWFAMLAGKETEVASGEAFTSSTHEIITPTSRTFIPARLSDNPYLTSTDYGRQLAALPEPFRSQLLYGDFDAGVEDDTWQIIPTAWITAAMDRWTPERPAANGKPVPLTAYGLDVARGGKDRTIATPRCMNWYGAQITRTGTETPDGQSVVMLMTSLPEGAETPWQIDVIGVGSSAFDIAAGNGFAVVPMSSAEKSDATDKSGRLTFANKRAEWWWKLREALDPMSGDDLAIQPDDELRADLTAPKWKISGRGIQVESKDDIKERLGRSPDKGDSLVYAHAVNVPQGFAVVNFYDAFARKNAS